jgi:hypothetical protein
VNDEATPGNDKYYGTDSSEGTKAWRTISLMAIAGTVSNKTFNVDTSQVLTFNIGGNPSLILDNSGLDPTIYLKPMILYIGDPSNSSSAVTITAANIFIGAGSYAALVALCHIGDTLKLFDAELGTGQWSAIADATDEADAVTKLNLLLANLRARGDMAAS